MNESERNHAQRICNRNDNAASERPAAMPTEAARREMREELASGKILKVKDLEIDEAKHTATLKGRPLGLTPKEFAILTCLMRVDGRPLSPNALFRAVWKQAPDAHCSNTVMVHIRHIRQKLRTVDPNRDYIETIWGVGYRLS